VIRIGWLAVVVALVALTACTSSSHLTESFGTSYRATLARQQAVETPPFRVAEKGLDAQEAAIISGSYRRSLAPPQAGSQREEPEVILVQQPQRGGQQRAPLAPSVPKD
jgi:hypothetical protein